MTEHIVAVFPNSGAAAAAERDLQDAGIPQAAMRRYAGNGSHTAQPVESAQPSGFWAWLLGEETTAMPTTDTRYGEDSSLYERRAAAGDTVLSVTIVDDSKIHRAIEVLDAHQPIEMDERTEGDAELDAADRRAVTDRSGPLGDGSTRRSDAVRGEEVIPLAEEQLEVGKRQVERGTTRVRRYVVETPVEQKVNLHGERVTVERRRPMTSAAPGEGAFEERVVEVRETEEIPVVQKTAHVTEEVAIRREETERAETIHDTVRREEVEITPDGTRRGPR